MQPCLRRIDADCFRSRPAWAKQAFAYRLVHLLTPKPLTKRLPKGLRRALIPPGVVWQPGDPLPAGAIMPAALPPGVETTGPTPPTYTEVWGPGPPSPAGRQMRATKWFERTIISSTNDGLIGAYDTDWGIVRGSPTNAAAVDYTTVDEQAMVARYYNTNYYINRSFLYFDLSEIPTDANIKTVTVGVIGHSLKQSWVCIQEGKQHDTLEAADWNAFEGTPFAHLEWQTFFTPNLNTNLFELNDDGKIYVKDKLGDTAKFCLREYTKDYLNETPIASVNKNGMYYADHATEERRPHIIVVYTL